MAQSSFLKTRRILITGGAGGLAVPAVVEFLSRGAEVAVLDRDPEKIAALKKAAERWQSSLTIKEVDLSDAVALRNAVSELIGEGERFDTLINNAAIYPSKPFEEYSLEEYQLIQKVNVESAVVCTQMLLPGMKDLKFGRIVNITSITFSGGWENLSAYVASKGTLIGLARTWAREFGEFGITVNCVAPGAFPTDAEKIHPDLESYTERIISSQAIKRRGNAADIVNALLFFIAEESGFITGQSLNVDGGWVMQ